MDKQLRTYQVLAWIVGVFVIFVVGGWLVGMAADPGSGLESFSETTASISPVHGVLYMALLVVTAVLSRNAGWTIAFTLTTMLLATIPFVSFWAERRAVRHTRELDRQALAAG